MIKAATVTLTAGMYNMLKEQGLLTGLNGASIGTFMGYEIDKITPQRDTGEKYQLTIHEVKNER